MTFWTESQRRTPNWIASLRDIYLFKLCESMNSTEQKCESRLQTASPALHSDPREILDWLQRFQLSASFNLCPLPKFSSDLRTKRKREFQAGRDLAAELLATHDEFEPVGVNDDRSPHWPAGFVGSISHSNHWVWAAVAQSSALRSIGIDTEPIVDGVTRQQILFEIATEDEWAIAESLGLNQEEIVSVVFSAKEAFYKCWYPVTPSYFGFEHATIELIADDRIRIRNLETNPNHGIGPESLDVFFLVKGNDVFTVTWMENEQS